MMMAITSIAGEVCNDLINQELASGGRIFQGIDLAGNSLPGNSLLSESVTRLSLSCWQRYETDLERQSLIEMINSTVSNNETQPARKSALLICTAMLSSLDALLN